MSYNGFATPLILQPKPSVVFATVLAVQHLLSLLVLSRLPLPWPIVALLVGLVGVSFYRTTRHYVLHQDRTAITQLFWESAQVVRVIYGEGSESKAILDGKSFVHPQLIILNLKLVSGGRRTLILFPDMADSDALRLLRVKLLMTRYTQT